jgi:hypothetical protein
MSLSFERLSLNEVDARLGNARELTANLLSEVVGSACTRFAMLRNTERAARAEQLIQSRAWTDAALELLAVELPQWQLRRIAYDAGEWYCALSRERELPEWLAPSIEARHTDLAIAILRALVGAREAGAASSRSSVPLTSPAAGGGYVAMCCDNFA